MITKEKLIEDAKMRQLNGALVEEIMVRSDSSINIESVRRIGDNDDFIIEKMDGESPEYTLIDDVVDFDYNISIKRKNGEVFKFADTRIYIFKKDDEYRATPFKIFDRDSYDGLKIKYGEKYCRILTFDIGSSIKMKEGETSIYSQRISMAIDNDDCFIYCINYTDGTLPTVLVSKERIDDIENYVFDKSTDTIFNTYFYPHEYKVVTEKVYPQTVFGSPGGNLKNMKFDEKIEPTTEGFIYSNTDDIFASRARVSSRVSVKFGNYEIGSYDVRNQFDMNNLFISNLPEDLKCSTSNEKVPGKELAKRFIPLIGQFINDYDEYDVYKYRDEGNIYLHNYENKICVVKELNNIIEIFSSLKVENNPIINYSIFHLNDEKELDNHFSIYNKIDDDTDFLFCFVTFGKYRNINVSRDSNMIMLDGGEYWLTTNKNGDVINTNLGITGTISAYNIFGIPVDF